MQEEKHTLESLRGEESYALDPPRAPDTHVAPDTNVAILGRSPKLTVLITHYFPLLFPFLARFSTSSPTTFRTFSLASAC